MIRAATAQDVQAIASVERTAAHAPWSDAAVLGSLSLTTSRAWVFQDDTGICGHLLTSLVIDSAEVLTIAVQPTHRRQGIASKLLQAAETLWRSAAVVEAWLEVRADNSGAIQLYNNHAWRQIGLRKHYYGRGVHAVQMKWVP